MEAEREMSIDLERVGSGVAFHISQRVAGAPLPMYICLPRFHSTISPDYPTNPLAMDASLQYDQERNYRSRLSAKALVQTQAVAHQDDMAARMRWDLLE